MREVNVRDTRENLAHLLDAVEAEEEVIVTRRGKPAARLVAATRPMKPFPDRSALRASIPPIRTSSVELVRALRDEEPR